MNTFYHYKGLCNSVISVLVIYYYNYTNILNQLLFLCFLFLVKVILVVFVCFAYISLAISGFFFSCNFSYFSTVKLNEKEMLPQQLAEIYIFLIFYFILLNFFFN